MNPLMMQLADGRQIPISHPVVKNRPFQGDRLVKVRLYGRLALVAGRKTFELAVSSVREAITALHYLSSQRTTQYIDSTQNHVRWRILVNGNQIDGDQPSVADELMIERNGIDTIDIYPIMEGAGNILGLILGAVLIVVGVVLSFMSGGIGTLAFATIGHFLLLEGAAIFLGGLLSLLDKPAKAQKPKKTQNNPSYLFSGTVNTQDQGGCVPVAYGNVQVGSQCIEAGITNSDIFETAFGQNIDWQVPAPWSVADRAYKEAVVAMRGVEQLQVQVTAATTPWPELGAQAFWGYVAQVSLVPYGFNIPTQQPVFYDNGPRWLMRSENGALAANYGPSGNVGPWTCILTLPQEIDPIIVTQLQDDYIGYAPTPNLP